MTASTSIFEENYKSVKYIKIELTLPRNPSIYRTVWCFSSSSRYISLDLYITDFVYTDVFYYSRISANGVVFLGSNNLVIYNPNGRLVRSISVA